MVRNDRYPSPTGTWRDLSAVITVSLLFYCFVIVDVLKMENNTRPAPSFTYNSKSLVLV